MGFVEVNGTLWDEKEYRRKVTLVKNYARYALYDALFSYGFERDGEYLYHEKLGLKVRLEFKEARS